MSNAVEQQTKKPKKPEVKSWYKDRNFSLIMQRNILLIFSLLLFISVIISLIVIKTIVEKKSVEPYVIKVSKQDNIPVSVNIDSVRQFASAQAGVLEYFLIEYIRARESYNHETYIYDYQTVVRRMSTANIYRDFWNSVNDQNTGIINQFGRNTKVDIVIKQIALESRNNIMVVRISKRLTQNGSVIGIQNYRIKLHYLLDVSNLTYRDIVVNPLGLKIDFYEILEERVVEINTDINAI